MKFSVVICTRNPQQHVIQKTLNCLGEQTLPFNEWELIIVDNDSDQPLANDLDIPPQLNAIHCSEKTRGLTFARLTGIQHAKAEIVVFVDDDNWLFPDYLESAWEKSKLMPALGTWGGQLIGEFETPHLNGQNATGTGWLCGN